MPPRRKASAPEDEGLILNIPPPATTIEGRNDQLILQAFNLAERDSMKALPRHKR